MIDRVKQKYQLKEMWWGFEHPGLVEGVCGRGWDEMSFENPTPTILWLWNMLV